MYGMAFDKQGVIRAKQQNNTTYKFLKGVPDLHNNTALVLHRGFVGTILFVPST
jgi:hypothetical protein